LQGAGKDKRLGNSGDCSEPVEVDPVSGLTSKTWAEEARKPPKYTIQQQEVTPQDKTSTLGNEAHKPDECLNKAGQLCFEKSSQRDDDSSPICSIEAVRENMNTTPPIQSSRTHLEPEEQEMHVDSDESSTNFSEETMSSAESCPNPRTKLLTREKNRLLRELMDQFYLQFSSFLGDRTRAYANGPNNDGTHNSFSTTRSGSASTGRTSNGSSGTSQVPTEGKDDGDETKNSDPRKASSPESGIRRKFACPFYQHNQIPYTVSSVTGRVSRACAGPGFGSVSRVK